MSSKLSTIIRNLTWTYASQLGSVVIQFGYAAVTSRLVSPAGFGSYAVALAVSGFVGLISTGGLGQSVARMLEVRDNVLRGLSTFAILLGLLGSGFLFVTASLWAGIWGDSGAVNAIELLSLGLLVAPHTGLTSGLMRRIGMFKKLALANLFSSCLGMVLGLWLVRELQSAAALAASTVITQIALFVICTALTRGRLIKLGGIGGARKDIGFSGNVMLSGMLAYLANNMGKWSVSHVLGASTLGQWNRADVVTIIPFFQIQSAIVQVVYPEFRHDRATANRAREVWPDLLSLVAWMCIPAGAVGAAVLPSIVPVLFGDGWELASALVVPMSIIASVQVVTTVLGGAVEAMGKFRWIWSSQILMIVVQLSGVMLTFNFRSIFPAVAAMAVVVVVRQVVYVSLLSRIGYMDWVYLVKNYLYVVLFACVMYLATRTIIVDWHHPSLVGCAVAVMIFLSLLAWRYRDRVPPVSLLRKYQSLQSR